MASGRTISEPEKKKPPEGAWLVGCGGAQPSLADIVDRPRLGEGEDMVSEDLRRRLLSAVQRHLEWPESENADAFVDDIVQELPHWRPIETAPSDGSWVLLRGGEVGYGWDGDEQPPMVVGQFLPHASPPCWQFAWYDSGYYGKYENPRHWMPLLSAAE